MGGAGCHMGPSWGRPLKTAVPAVRHSVTLFHCSSSAGAQTAAIDAGAMFRAFSCVIMLVWLSHGRESSSGAGVQDAIILLCATLSCYFSRRPRSHDAVGAMELCT